ncbi:SET-domain containing protein lysine methyltransferase family protein [Rhynchospora pubera]|uniref:SET-domain containing protein lysine methyltransferase family protein n=1 Tax=Rhynchospora pubera TaxID=906938 RepID=A0AAV8H2T6_9POAL|nr:SET-domain containing protein lysine methyltransferase family protein [Rhynchospora pubera]
MSQEQQEKKERICKALSAMESLGIKRKIVIPVLKRLLHAFENQWEHIEADSYSALADAIFEAQDSQVGYSADNKRPVMPGEKRLKSCKDAAPSHDRRRDGPECQPPPQNRAPAKKRPLFEQGELSSNSREPYASNKPIPHNSALMSRENVAMTLPHTGERSVAQSSRGTSCQNNNLLSSADPMTELEHDQAGFGPLAMVHPSYFLDSSANVHPNSHGSSIRKARGKEKEIIDSEGQGTSANLELAATEDVNLSFICRDKLLCDPNFQMPTIEAVCQDVEERYLRSYKILDPNFSLRNILEAMCRSFSELGHTPQEKRRNGNINIIPAPGAQHLCERLPAALPFNGSNSMFNMALVSTGASRPIYHDDISRGEEMMPISIERVAGSLEEHPLQFRYIARNIPYQNAYVSINLARIDDESCCSDCHDDCLQNPFGCACASETAGVFVYTMDGVLRAEFLEACMALLRDPKQWDFFYCKEWCPLERLKNEEQPEKCKGHLMRKFIKECWAKCGCNRQCGNRVVQRGITCNLQVFKTGEQKGWGLRTMEDLPKGKFVCEYVGEILTNIELYDRHLSSRGNKRHTYPVLLDADWSTEGVLKDEEALCLDATYYGNVARFINHRCFDGNLIGIPVEIETPDHHYYHLAFFTTRDVSAMEELTWDYGIDFDDHEHPIEAFSCRCGSAFCRDKSRFTKESSRKLVLR